jgi:hypothetical protein
LKNEEKRDEKKRRLETKTSIYARLFARFDTAYTILKYVEKRVTICKMNIRAQWD